MSHPSYDELRKLLDHAAGVVPVEVRYQHYSTGDIYRVIGHTMLKHSDEVAVIYEPIECPEITWTAPLDEFIGLVTVNGWIGPRFQRLEESG